MDKKKRNLLFFIIIPVAIFLIMFIIAIVDIASLKERTLEINILLIVLSIVIDIIYLLVYNFIDLRLLK